MARFEVTMLAGEVFELLTNWGFKVTHWKFPITHFAPFRPHTVYTLLRPHTINIYIYKYVGLAKHPTYMK